MKTTTPVDSVLVEAFLALTPVQKDNLRWHLEHKTRIFCGPGSNQSYLSEDGYG